VRRCSEPLDAALLGRLAGQAANAVTSHRTPKTSRRTTILADTDGVQLCATLVAAPPRYICALNMGLALLLALGVDSTGLAAEIPKAPVPKSPYIAVVYRYADKMLKNGRDQHGPSQ
jgi:hypothetical protein